MVYLKFIFNWGSSIFLCGDLTENTKSMKTVPAQGPRGLRRGVFGAGGIAVAFAMGRVLYTLIHRVDIIMPSWPVTSLRG